MNLAGADVAQAAQPRCACRVVRACEPERGTCRRQGQAGRTPTRFNRPGQGGLDVLPFARQAPKCIVIEGVEGDTFRHPRAPCEMPYAESFEIERVSVALQEMVTQHMQVAVPRLI